jgi:endonuclease-8
VPEGDTVWLAGRRLAEALATRTLVHGELRHPRLSTVELAGVPVDEVVSVGKHLLTRFGDGRTLHTHFRMDGSWHLYRPGEVWRGPRHQVRAVLEVVDRVAVGFRLHDMALVPTAQEHRLVGHLGPDLLGADWGPGQEAEATRRLAATPERELGLALLDQTVMAGVGNLYKTEVCFLLGVSPWSPVSAVDPAAAVALSRRLLLRNAEHPEQSTTGELARGAQHWVFERTGRACARCGDVVRRATQGTGAGRAGAERIAYWCPTCQPGPHPAVDTGGRRPQQPTPQRRR